MTKRFTLTDWHEVKDNGKIMTVDEVINMLNDQQDTIRKLQDLCGKSDYENAKVRQKFNVLKNAIRIAYEEKPYPTIDDIQAKFKELQE